MQNAKQKQLYKTKGIPRQAGTTRLLTLTALTVWKITIRFPIDVCIFGSLQFTFCIAFNMTNYTRLSSLYNITIFLPPPHLPQCGSFSNKAKAEIKLLKDDLKHGISKLGIANGNKNKL